MTKKQIFYIFYIHHDYFGLKKMNFILFSILQKKSCLKYLTLIFFIKIYCF